MYTYAFLSLEFFVLKTLERVLTTIGRNLQCGTATAGVGNSSSFGVSTAYAIIAERTLLLICLLPAHLRLYFQFIYEMVSSL